MNSASGAVPLRELLVTTKDGDWGKSEPAEGYLPYRVIRGADFDRVRFGDVASVPLRYLPARTVGRRTLEPDDILIETAGGTSDRPTGRTLLVTPRVLQRLGGSVSCASFARFLRVDRRLALPAYVYWYLQDRYARGALRQHEVRHTGVGRFQYTNFAANERISLPPMEDQRAISATLGALDDKIDSNRRVTSLCWLICATSYRALIDGAPMVELRDLLELKYGKALPERDRRVGEVPVFGSGGHVGHHDAPLIEGPAVIVGRKGSVGSVFYCATGCFPIDTTFYAEPKVGVPILLAYFALKGARLEVMNTDSAVPGLNREAALSRLVPRPATAAVDRWVALAGDLVARANHAEAETRTLMHMRATLLPALMSGQFRVQEARSAKQSG